MSEQACYVAEWMRKIDSTCEIFLQVEFALYVTAIFAVAAAIAFVIDNGLDGIWPNRPTRFK